MVSTGATAGTRNLTYQICETGNAFNCDVATVRVTVRNYDIDAVSDQMINTYVSPSPVGGKAIRVYKASQDIIDSTNRGVLQGIVNAGVVFINFLGHSSGSIWEEDIGDPNVFQNSTGMLPFVSSVSCNVGGFADQTINTLGEEFTRADNRGAIAV